MSPRTPDRHHGPILEYDHIQLFPGGEIGDGEGRIRYTESGYFELEDSEGTFDPRAGSGISEAQHKALRQLIHFIEDGPAEGFVSGAYKETTPTGPFPTSEIWWESVSKLKKIVELTTSWTGVNITQEVWQMYATDGSTVLATVTDVISYSGPFETSRTRTIA